MNQKIRLASARIRAQQADLNRYEHLELVLSYLREFADQIHPQVRFSASQFRGHEAASDYVKEWAFRDWATNMRQVAIAACEKEMLEIEERLK